MVGKEQRVERIDVKLEVGPAEGRYTWSICLAFWVPFVCFFCFVLFFGGGNTYERSTLKIIPRLSDSNLSIM